MRRGDRSGRRAFCRAFPSCPLSCSQLHAAQSLGPAQVAAVSLLVIGMSGWDSTPSALVQILESPKWGVARACQAVEECILANG